MQEKIRIHTSPSTLRLLQDFLADPSLTSILSILNAEFIFDTQDQAWDNSASRGSGGSGAHLVPLSWRVPGKHSAACKRKRTDDEDGSDSDEDSSEGVPSMHEPFFRSLLDRVVLPRMLAAHRYCESPPLLPPTQ